MIKIFDKNHNAVGHISKYRDLKIESILDSGDKTLAFTLLEKGSIANEMYLSVDDEEYVVKEVPATTGSFPQIVAILNLEDLQRDMWQTFSVSDTTIDAAARTVLAGTGWIIGQCDVTKKRNVGMTHVSTLDVIQNLCVAFMCDPVFDTKNKTVSFYGRRGEDKGAYFMAGLNLKKLQKKSTSYDYYTRIVPIGQDGLTIETVNDGKEYLENFQYSNKILTYIWKDESYTNPQALKEDAELKLEDMSKPMVSYSVDVRDLAAQSEEYAILSYDVGDTVVLIDQETGTRIKQRIKKIVRYPDDPNKNTCEIANTMLTFEELQSKYSAAAQLVNYTISSDGKIKVSDILHFENGIAGSPTISGMQNNIATMQGDLADTMLIVGEINTNYIKAEEADLKYATIANLNAANATINSLSGDYATFKTTTTEELNAHTAVIDSLESTYATIEDLDATNATIDNLGATYANIDFSNIGKAAMEYFYANSGLIDNVVVGDATISGELVGVTIKGDLIEANTVVADKLVIQGEDGLYYKLNTDGVKIDTEQTDYNSLNGQVIRAKSVTAEKIAVEDLVAFGATIGGFKIGDSSIYSGVKESVDNNTRGIYMDNQGQLAIGDSQNFIKYYKDQNGNYRLEVSAESIVFGSSGTNVDTAISDAQAAAEAAIISSIEEFYQSDSPTSLTGGEWSIVQPVWIDGKYIWRRTKNTHGNGDINYAPSENGVCITGNTGAQGEHGQDSIMLYIDSSNGTVFKNSSVETILSVVIYYGGHRITDAITLRTIFGNTAYLQWKWKLPEHDDYISVDLEDYRLGADGFTFTITPDDVTSRATIICELNV